MHRMREPERLLTGLPLWRRGRAWPCHPRVSAELLRRVVAIHGLRGARILLDNFTEMAPIVYTPTVGWACLNYHLLFRRPRGMYFSANDTGEMVRRAAWSGQGWG